MNCDICGVNPATTTITKITASGRETLRLCEICAAKRRGQSYESGRFAPFSFFDESPFFDFAEPRLTPRQETINITDYFSERAKDVVQKAAETAVSLNHQTLDTEHLLIAL